MSVNDIALAEEALSLPAAERAGLAKLLMESLGSDSRSDEEVRLDLLSRLNQLQSGTDQGMTFREVFGEAL